MPIAILTGLRNSIFSIVLLTLPCQAAAEPASITLDELEFLKKVAERISPEVREEMEATADRYCEQQDLETAYDLAVCKKSYEARRAARNGQLMQIEIPLDVREVDIDRGRFSVGLKWALDAYVEQAEEDVLYSEDTVHILYAGQLPLPDKGGFAGLSAATKWLTRATTPFRTLSVEIASDEASWFERKASVIAFVRGTDRIGSSTSLSPLFRKTVTVGYVKLEGILVVYSGSEGRKIVAQYWASSPNALLKKLREPCDNGRTYVTLVACCWPGQSWNSAGQRCAGRPGKCPNGMTATEDGCEAMPAPEDSGDKEP